MPQETQQAFHLAARLCDGDDGPTEIGFGGARGGAKTHAVFAQVAIDDCARRPGLKFLLLRRIGKANAENVDDLRRRLLKRVAHNYYRGEGRFEFPNDSRIILGHFKDEKDIDNYLGIEYDGIAIEEATQLTEQKYLELQTCCRTSKPDWRPRTYTTTNPGGIGHAWYKQRFIQPWREQRETSTRFIFSTYKDNHFLNSGYARVLDQLKGWQLAAWRDGDWDIAGGQFFTNWRHERHVVEPFPIPRHWRVWCSLDHGFTHPTVVHLFAENDGIIYVVDEHVEARVLVPGHAYAIHNMLQRHAISKDRLWTFEAGHDVFSQRGDSEGKTIAQQYAQYGIFLSPANIDRINGAAELLSRLGDPDTGDLPRLQIFKNCRRLIQCLPELQHDPHNPEDVLKINADDSGNGGDDAYDSLRYGLMASPMPKPSFSIVAGPFIPSVFKPVTGLGAALRTCGADIQSAL